MTPDEVYADLEERLMSASRTLRTLAASSQVPRNERLIGKAQGVSLALDYLRSYRDHLENPDA